MSLLHTSLKKTPRLTGPGNSSLFKKKMPLQHGISLQKTPPPRHHHADTTPERGTNPNDVILEKAPIDSSELRRSIAVVRYEDSGMF
jgi:hypothetical protein